MSVLLDLEHVTKAIGTRRVLDSVDLQVETGEVVGLLGPNGAGKSTLIRLITAQSRASSGTITVLGEVLDAAGRLPEGIGVMTEQPGFIEHLPAPRYLARMARLAGIGADISELLLRVGLDPSDRRPTRKYSLGMRQRLAMAQLLLVKPKLAILDEPTNGLDALGIIEFRVMIDELARDGTGVLMSSHLLGEVERSCRRIVLLNRGKIEGSISLRDLDHRRIRLGLAREADWKQIEDVMDVRDLVRHGQFGVFSSRDSIDSVVAAAVRAGVGVVHVSLEPVDLESILVAMAAAK